jgi:hypothetical protein
MLVPRRGLLLVAVGVVVLSALWLVFALDCPSAGIAIMGRTRELHRLKNRTAFPQATDFDPLFTLDAWLQPGDDRSRWSIERAARVQGFVIDVWYAGAEGTNCFNPCRRDVHIHIAKRKDAPKNEQVVVEVTPRFRDWAAAQGIDWTAQALRGQLMGHWVEFEGWLFFDARHAEEAENTAPGNPENWRATAWEVHPVTKIRVIN